ncbi:MAG: cobalamin B12-binding domain-containing protein [Thermoleophilia bacterium]
MSRLERLKEALIELEEDRALELTREARAEGTRSLTLLQVGEGAMRVVGERYERHEYYLSGLILAGEIFREVLEMVQPGLEAELSGEGSGRVLLGTVGGDIHDIGKNIVATALRSFGFTVEDLGVDVAPARFLERALDFGPDVVGLSGLVTSSYQSMKDTVELLRRHEAEAGGHVPVVIGGGLIDEEVRRYVGADSWTTDAMEGVRICQRLTEAH